MKKTVVKLLPVSVFSMLFFSFLIKAQETPKTAAALPDDVNKIITASCTPCHSSQGGLMSKAKLNVTEWANYSPEKQKEKAAKIYSEISEGKMPPKMTREKRPELIPTKEQEEIIKKWAESFPAETK